MVTRREAAMAVLSTLVAASAGGVEAAEAPLVVTLPPPRTAGGMPLLEALKARHSTRSYIERALSRQTLSDLLWAADGINRSQDGFRTAPSSHSYFDIDLYLAMADGVWLYDPKGHRLMRHMPDDLRGLTTTGQDFVKTVPLNVIYVSDASRMGKDVSESDRLLNGIADSAVIAQNVYLFCASVGLGAVVRASVPGAALAKRLQLKPAQAIYLAQSVGYPKTG
jgi:nitroreductase